MTDIDATATEGKCVLCGDLTDFAARIGGLRPILSVSGDKINYTGWPPIWLCPADVRRYNLDNGVIGWCGECESWGETFRISPCGEPYMPRIWN